MSTPSLSVDEKMAMLLWLNWGNKILTHRAKIVKMSSNQLFKFRAVKNNKFVCVLKYLPILYLRLK